MSDTWLIDAPQTHVAAHRWSFDLAIDETRDSLDDLDRLLLSGDGASFRRDFDVFRMALSANLTRFFDAWEEQQEEIEDVNAQLLSCQSEDNYEQELKDLEKEVRSTVRSFRHTFDWFKSGGRDQRDLEDALRELEAIAR